MAELEQQILQATINNTNAIITANGLAGGQEIISDTNVHTFDKGTAFVRPLGANVVLTSGTTRNGDALGAITLLNGVKYELDLANIDLDSGSLLVAKRAGI